MFLRKNYLPKVCIKQDFDTKGWFAYESSEYDIYRSFCILTETDEAVILYRSDPTMFNSLDSLMDALYKYGCNKHKEDIKRQLTQTSTNIRL